MRVEEKGRGQENVVSLYPKALGLFGFFPVTIFGSRVARERNRGSFYVDAINGGKAAFGRLKRRKAIYLSGFQILLESPAYANSSSLLSLGKVDIDTYYKIVRGAVTSYK